MLPLLIAFVPQNNLWHCMKNIEHHMIALLRSNLFDGI